MEGDLTSNVFTYKDRINKGILTMFAFAGFVVIMAAAGVGSVVVYTKVKHWREDAQRYYDHVVNQNH